MADPGLIARLASYPVDPADEQWVAREMDAWSRAEDVDLTMDEWLGWSFDQLLEWEFAHEDRIFDSTSDAASWSPPAPKPAHRMEL